MSDELATTSIEYNGRVYHLKVFANMLMIERQPNGHNIPFPREGVAGSVYSDATQAWDYESIGALIDIYEADANDTHESRD